MSWSVAAAAAMEVISIKRYYLIIEMTVNGGHDSAAEPGAGAGQTQGQIRRSDRRVRPRGRIEERRSATVP